MDTPTETVVDPTAPVTPRPFRLDCSRALADHQTSHVAKVMGVTPRTVQRWIEKGVDGITGDKLAVKVCGVDAYQLWGRDFDRAFDDDGMMVS